MRRARLPLAKVRGEIGFSGLTFAYPGKEAPAVHGIRFLSSRRLHLRAGRRHRRREEHALLAAPAALRPAKPGVITIDGTRHPRQSLRLRCGNTSRWSTRTASFFTIPSAANIRYGRLDATDAEIEAAAKLAHAHEFILAQSQGYDTVIGDKGCMISGGQQQRVCIARALAEKRAHSAAR